jgi:predicted secreted protein
VVAARGILAALTVVVGAACSASTSSDTGGSTPPTEVGSALSDPAVDGAPATSGGEAAAPSTAAPVRPEGFTQVMLRVVESTGEVCEICVWLADAGDERSRGLMGVTDLGEPVGMAFAYSAATAGRF